jgi:hypothetical protein
MSLHCKRSLIENEFTIAMKPIKRLPIIIPKYLNTTGRERIPAPIIVLIICKEALKYEECPSP